MTSSLSGAERSDSDLMVSLASSRWQTSMTLISKSTQPISLFLFYNRHHVSHHSYTHLGESSKSGLEIRLHLQRRISLHVTQTFVPSSMFVFISWLSLFIPAELVPGRMALCVTTLLTLVTMFSSTRSSAPSTAYLKSTDIWMFGCLFTVFTILSEYCLVLYVRKMAQNSGKQDEEQEKSIAWKVICSVNENIQELLHHQTE